MQKQAIQSRQDDADNAAILAAVFAMATAGCSTAVEHNKPVSAATVLNELDGMSALAGSESQKDTDHFASCELSMAAQPPELNELGFMSALADADNNLHQDTDQYTIHACADVPMQRDMACTSGLNQKLEQTQPPHPVEEHEDAVAVDKGRLALDGNSFEVSWTCPCELVPVHACGIALHGWRVPHMLADIYLGLPSPGELLISSLPEVKPPGLRKICLPFRSLQRYAIFEAMSPKRTICPTLGHELVTRVVQLRMWDSYPLRISGYPRISADMGADSDMNYSYFLRTYWNFTKKVPLES
eukprot:355053-Chlamydomonas_euryale.AAC.8